MGLHMLRRDIVMLPNNDGINFGSSIIVEHANGFPLQPIFHKFGVEFNELFVGKLTVVHDTSAEGIEEVVLYNNAGSLMYIRPNGLVKITFIKSDAIKKYEGSGVFDIVTRKGTKRQHRRLRLNPNSLQPYFMNGGDCY